MRRVATRYVTERVWLRRSRGEEGERGFDTHPPPRGLQGPRAWDGGLGAAGGCRNLGLCRLRCSQTVDGVDGVDGSLSAN